MVVQEQPYFPLPAELKKALLEEFADDSDLKRLIQAEALGLGERLLRFYRRIYRTFDAREILAVEHEPGMRAVKEASQIVRTERLLRRWLRWAEQEFQTPELFKQHFWEFFPHAGEDWKRWLEDPGMILGQLKIARDDLSAERDALGHNWQESVGDRDRAIELASVLIDEWERILSHRFERRERQVPAISAELGF